MRAVVITKFGPPEVLQVQERPDPALGAGQVRVTVAAAGLNFAEVMARQGLYADAPKPPCVVGYEVAGTVAEVGEGVTSVSVGDRVIAGTEFGGHAEQVVTVQARRDPRLRRRPPGRLPQGRLGEGAAEVRRHPRRPRRLVVQPQL